MSPEQEQRNQVRNPAATLEALSRTFLDSALDCIITMDATGHVREFNPASERVFGFTRAEAVGKELADLIIPPRFRERHRQGLAHYLKTGQGPLLGRLIEIAGLRRDGTEILVALAINATRSMGRQFLRLTCATSPSKSEPKKLTAAWLRSLSPPVTRS